MIKIMATTLGLLSCLVFSVACGRRMMATQTGKNQIPSNQSQNQNPFSEFPAPTPTPIPPLLACSVSGPTAPLKAFGKATGEIVDQAPIATFKAGVLNHGTPITFTISEIVLNTATVTPVGTPVIGSDGLATASFRALVFGHHVLKFNFSTTVGPISCEAPFDLEKVDLPADPEVMVYVNGDFDAIVPNNGSAMINYSAPAAEACEVTKSLIVNGAVASSAILPYTAKTAEFSTGPLTNLSPAPIQYLYKVTCRNSQNVTRNDSVTVNVNPSVAVDLVARAAGQTAFQETLPILLGTTLELKWSSVFAVQCLLFRNGVPAALSGPGGNLFLTDVGSTTEFVLACNDGLNPNVTDAVQVQVIMPTPSPSPSPSPTPTPAPVCVSNDITTTFSESQIATAMQLTNAGLPADGFHAQLACSKLGYGQATDFSYIDPSDSYCSGKNVAAWKKSSQSFVYSAMCSAHRVMSTVTCRYQQTGPCPCTQEKWLMDYGHVAIVASSYSSVGFYGSFGSKCVSPGGGLVSNCPAIASSDGVTPQKVCELLGYRDVKWVSSAQNSSCGDNTIAVYNAATNTFMAKDACAIKDKIQEIKCTTPISENSCTGWY